jgi:hypothetical protein
VTTRSSGKPKYRDAVAELRCIDDAEGEKRQNRGRGGAFHVKPFVDELQRRPGFPSHRNRHYSSRTLRWKEWFHVAA